MKSFWRRYSKLLRTFVRRNWRIVAIVGGVLFVIVIVQLLYPRGRTLPFARLDGERVSSQTKTQIVQQVLDQYGNVPLTLSVRGPVKIADDKTTITQAGLGPDTARIIDGLSDYPWWQRLIPLSLPIKGLMTNQSIVTSLDNERFNEYAKLRLAACAVAPKNASVAVKSGKVVLDPAKDGQKCDKATLQKNLLHTTLKKAGAHATIKSKAVHPVRTDKNVSGLLKIAQALTERKLALKLNGTDYPIAQATLASWLVFAEDSKNNKKLTVDVDTKPIRDYLSEMQKKIYIAPGLTTIQTLDSVETARTEGASGRGINHTTTADALKKQVQSGNGTVTGELVAIPPRVVYRRTYTSTRAGLQALLNDLVFDKGDFGIAVRMLDGSVMGTSGAKRYHPASMYKLYVAYSVLKRIASGEMHWEDTATAGKNIGQCFDVMIVNSDNACAEWLGDTVGWAKINTEVRAIGLTNTNTIRGTMYTTAEDQTLFLTKLHTGTILGPTESSRLIELMKRQVYRSGIPAGVGVPVADKVGFLDGKLHDAAIVYGPKTYTMAILSSGSTWAQIADAARQIHAQLNRM